MADNIQLNTGTGGAVLAADDISSVWYQIAKLAHGALDAATLVSTSSGLPVQQQGTWVLGANSGVDVGDVTINNGAGASAVNVQDGGNAITVDNGGTFAVQPTTAIGAANLANGQVSVTTTAGNIVSSRATRRAVTIVNHGTTDVYLGVATVTTSNGLLLEGVSGAAVTIYTTAAIQGIVASGTQTVSYIEEYD